MPRLALHLLLRTDGGASRAAALLRAAGYLVSRIDDDGLAERLAGAPHVDAVVVELPALAAIHFGHALAARYGAGELVVLVITPAADTVRRAVPAALVLTPLDLDDDLVSTIDLALVARQTRSAPLLRSA